MKTPLYRIWNEHIGDYVKNVCATGYGVLFFNGSQFAIDDTLGYRLERCTGLLDGAGDIIYENDYLMDWRNNTYKVVWLDEQAQFFCENINNDTDGYFFDSDVQNMYISGNTHIGVKQNAFWCDRYHSSMIG